MSIEESINSSLLQFKLMFFEFGHQSLSVYPEENQNEQFTYSIGFAHFSY